MARRVLTVLSAVALLLVACSSFESGGEPDAGSGVDAGADGVAPPGPPIPDGAVPAEGGLLPCAAPLPALEPFATVGGAITHIVTDDAYVYWVADGKTLQRQAVAGGGTETIRVDIATISALVLVPDYVVFVTTSTYASAKVVDAGAPVLVGGGLAPIGGHESMVVGHNGNYLWRAAPPTILSAVSLVSAVSAVTANATEIFFVAAAGDAGPGRAVYAVPNAPTYTATARQVFYSQARDPSLVAVDNANVYMLDVEPNGAVVKAPVAGGPETALVEGEPGLRRIAARDAFVYYSSSTGLRRVDKAGGTCKTVLAADPVDGFALTAQHAYFASGTNLVRVPR